MYKEINSMYTTGGFGFGGGLPKAVKFLLIANAVVFLLMMLFPYRSWSLIFGLVPELISDRFWIWQFFTYMFLHANFMHIFFNMFALWMFGTELEYNWGTRDFPYFYFTCGIGGGLLVWITAMLGFSSMIAATIGASGAIFGLLVAYGMMWPDRLIFIFGIIPMKALHFVLLFGALDLMQGLSQSGGGIAYFAHVGGGVTGFLYLKFGWRIMVHLSNWQDRLKYRFAAKRHGFRVYHGGAGEREQKSPENRPGKPSDREHKSQHPDYDEEIDRILDKIAREGMNSLSEREHRILEGASKRKRRSL